VDKSPESEDAFPNAGMMRIMDDNFKRMFLCSMPWARPASAKVGSHQGSATKPAATTAPLSTNAFPSSSPISRSRAVMAVTARLLRELGGVQLLILDDWGLEPLDGTARHDLLEILEERYGRRSTIITSQIPVDKWHDGHRATSCRNARATSSESAGLPAAVQKPPYHSTLIAGTRLLPHSPAGVAWGNAREGR
jgi:hypothetical protein